MGKSKTGEIRKLLQFNRLFRGVLAAFLGIVSFALLAQDVFAQPPPLVWSRQLSSGLFSDTSGEVALDKDDNFYLNGNFIDPVATIGNQTLTNRSVMENGFIAKFSRAGDFLWVQQIGGNYEDYPISCATDSQGDVFVTGVLGSTNVVFGDTVLTNLPQGTESCFVAKYDPQGDLLWVHQSLTTVVPNQGATWDFGTSVAIDAVGNAWVAGTFSSSNIFFGTNALVNPDYAAIQPGISQDFLVKYSSIGDVLWARAITVSTDNNYPNIGLDTNGNAFFCDSFPASATVGTNAVTNVFGSSQCLLLAKFDSGGNALWVELAAYTGSGAYMFQGPLVVDLQGNVWISGSYFSGAVAFPSNTLPATNQEVGFVAKFDGSGNFLWAAVPTNQIYSRISVDAIGNGYAADRYGASKYAADGTVLWNTVGLGQTDGFGMGVVDPAGSLFLVGGDGSVSHGYIAAELSGPYLNIQPLGNQAVISWPTNEVGYGLEFASSLSGPWSAMTNPSPAVLGNQYAVTNNASAGSQFYRLGSH